MEVLTPQRGREVAAIVVKGLGKDEFGLQQYVWATKKQLARLLEAQFDEVERNFVFKLGDRGIRPCDLISFKIVELKTAREWPAFKPYVVGALNDENEKDTRYLSESWLYDKDKNRKGINTNIQD